MALVFDITDVGCPLPASLFIDTNAWLDICYPPYSFPGTARKSAMAHADFFSRCLADQVPVLRTPFSLPEMAHIIEKETVEDYARGAQRSIRAKQSRTMPNLRRQVISKVVAAWKDVKRKSEACDEFSVDDVLADKALVRYGVQPLDGYDLFVVEQVLGSPEKALLTDDADYLAVPGLKLYTANQKAIQAAKEADRFRPR